MTIRFLTGWNSYYEGKIVSGLSNEAALVSAGIASYDLDGGNNGTTFSGVATLSTDASGNTVLVGADGLSIPTMLKNKTVWYRLRHKSGATLVDAMGNGPNIPVVAAAGTPNLWTTAKMATPPNDGTGKASTYARVIGDAYLNALCALEPLIASKGLLFMSGDIYPASATPDKTQTLFQYGAGSANPTDNTSWGFTQHITSGNGRMRVNSNADDGTYGPITGVAETAASLTAGARNCLCGYIDMLNMTVGISVNGGAFVVSAIDQAAAATGAVWSDATARSKGCTSFAINPTAGGVPTVFMGGSASTLGTKCSGLFITRFDTHPGLDYIDQLATEFYDTVGAFPEILKTGKY